MGGKDGEGVVYGKRVREEMGTWEYEEREREGMMEVGAMPVATA